MNKINWRRRQILGAGLALATAPRLAITAEREKMISKTIPVSGESLPVVGLGTYNVFDVESSAAEIELRRKIVELLTRSGGSLLDTSPMYNRSENVIGDIVSSGTDREQLFLATKVWTDGKDAGIRQMQRSAELMQTDVIDLMQVQCVECGFITTEEKLDD